MAWRRKLCVLRPEGREAVQGPRSSCSTALAGANFSTDLQATDTLSSLLKSCRILYRELKCPHCHGEVGFRDVAKERCPTCTGRLYWSDRWRWLRGLSCVLLAILLVSHWFPHEADIGYFLLWLVVLVFRFLCSVHQLVVPYASRG